MGSLYQRIRFLPNIIENLRNTGWNCGYMTTTDGKGRPIWVVAAEHSDARDGDKEQGGVANTLKLYRNGASGLIDLLVALSARGRLY
jgi:hypothetical protein